MNDASVLQSDLIDFLCEYGGTMTVCRIVPGAYDASTGAVAASNTTNYTGLGRLGNYRDALVTGELIKQNDRRVTFVPDDATFVPQVDDLLTNGSDVYTVINSKPREIGGSWICYSMQVRR